MRRVAACLLLGSLIQSCASPTLLARQSDRELQAGNVHRAYEKARTALDRDLENARARAAMTAAATQLVDGWKTRILSLAGQDTVAAAGDALELDDLRFELVRYRVAVPADSGFDDREMKIRRGAAGIHYRLGEESLEAHRPKEAYGRFKAAHEVVPTYGDVERRIEEAYERALTRVAILPFANQTGVPGLSREVMNRVYDQVGGKVGSSGFQFTRFVGLYDVLASVSAAQVEDLSRDQALEVGRWLGADEVVLGRFHTLRSSSNTERHHHTIYRKVEERDTSGARRARFVEVELTMVARERAVSVNYDMELVNVQSHGIVASRSEPLEATARVLWTDYRAEGDCDDYCLVPPDHRKRSPERAREIEKRWAEHCGTWTVPEFLERARNGANRVRYTSSLRGQFHEDSRKRPVYLGELPGEDDLAFIALEGVWYPMLGALADLDQQDLEEPLGAED